MSLDKLIGTQVAQDAAEERVDHFRKGLGPFVVAAEQTRMPMIFTDAQIAGNPVVFANDSFLSLTGFGRLEILGKGISDLFEQMANSSTHSEIEHAIDQELEGTWELQCRRADGTEYLATVLLSPVLDDKGLTAQHFLSFTEVPVRTDRLRAQRNEFNALYEQAPGFIATLEGEGHWFTFANASYKRLVGREHVVGHRMIDVLPEAADQGLIDLLDEVFRTGEPYVGKSVPLRILEGYGPSSGLHYVDFVNQPVRDGEGRITGVFVGGNDVTAERLSAEQLSLLQGEIAHASRVNAMGMMAVTLAHELNQPLTAILTYAGASARLVAPSSPQAGALSEALHAIEEAAQRAGNLIRNVRELTLRGETPKTRFNISAAITECIPLVHAVDCRAGTIDYPTRKDLPVLADRLQIQQVVINLLRNACEAISEKEDGRVTIDATLDGAEVIIGVTDTGPGFSSRSADCIFEWSESSKPGGTGLGLSISRTLVEAQHGRIWLERSDSSGSRFCFSLPAADHKARDQDGS